MDCNRSTDSWTGARGVSFGGVAEPKSRGDIVEVPDSGAASGDGPAGDISCAGKIGDGVFEPRVRDEN